MSVVESPTLVAASVKTPDCPPQQLRAAHVVAGLIVALLLGGCSSYAKVTETRPTYQPVPGGSGALAQANARITSAQTVDGKYPLAALADYLAALEAASSELRRAPQGPQAISTYNFALSRIMSILRETKLEPWSKPLHVPTKSGGDFIITHRPDNRPNWNPANYDFIPANQLTFTGTYVTDRNTRPGVGAPMVAVGKNVNKNARADFALKRVFYGVTAVARFEGRRCLLSFEDPLAKETVSLDRHVLPLAADFTAPLAMLLEAMNPKSLEMSRMFRPDKYTETALLARLQPYDPNKTVVLVIHGLMDSPATWAPMLNSLRNSDAIRRKYQFWFFSYPSGYPYPYSAMLLRRELDGVERKFPLRHKMIVIGHSMGGCIARLLITDTRDGKLWFKTFKAPPEQVKMSEENKKLFSEALIFKSRSEVGEVIFMAAPLRGSKLAVNPLARLASKLIKAPLTLLKAGAELGNAMVFQPGELKINHIPDSIETLAPNNRFVLAINTIPITPGVTHFTIVGDRGRGDAPNSSDGVVPYWSSHMDDAVSETIVPSGHSVHQNAKAIAKVEQMLLRRTPSGSRKLKRENRKPKVPFRGDATRDSQTPETGGQKAEFRD